ncbi:MAG TPA: FABP family protein [Anaerolineales bacterium]|nr:FABP family protein [Anaerolineales bacterium]
MNNQNILHAFLGEWSGTGRGEFPTIEPFDYLETLSFATDGRAFLHYEQKTQRHRAGEVDYVPSHWESGFIRLLADGQLELTCAQNGGRLEGLSGSIEETKQGLILRLTRADFLNDARMLGTSRTIAIQGDLLHYIQTMHTTAVPRPTQHLEATLHRRENS